MNNKGHLLVVDDEPAMRKLLRIVLENEGWKVSLAGTAQEAIQTMAIHPPDLVLLDIGLPDKSGMEVLEDIRGWYEKPIIMLTAHDTEDLIVRALDEGAADYLTKPFRTAELTARIRAALRRSLGSAPSPIVISGSVRIDLAAHSVWRDDKLMKLTATEFQLLAMLATHQGRVLTHQHLLKEVWGISYVEETQYLRVFIGNLRKKLEDDPNRPRILLTESGVGYRMI